MKMNNWLGCLVSDKEIKAIYGANVPELSGVNVHEILLHRDGPKVTLRFDFPDFPDHPPQKWIENGFNCVQVSWVFSGVSDFEINGWGANFSSNISIWRDPDGLVSLEVVGDCFKVSLKSDFSYIERISAYLDKAG